MIRFLCFIFVFVITFQLASAAVGISPGSYTVDFTPGLRQQFTFEFLGDSGRELEIYVAGDLAEYAELSKERIEGNGAVEVLLKLPKELDRPGIHSIYVGARQITEGQGFGIIGNVKGVINVIVPYPGQYALISLVASNANVGENVLLTANVENLGSETVNSVAKISVYNSENFITEFDLGEFILASPEKRTFHEELETSKYAAGNYRAVATLLYGDGQSSEANTTFRLGELKVNIVNYTKIFERNSINKFEVQVESSWNDPINNVYAEINIPGYPINFLTPSSNIGSFGTTTLTGFFDTTGIQNDTFPALIKVHYEGRSTEELVTLSFRKEIDYLIVGLVVAIVLIAALVIFVTYVLRRAEKRRR